VERVSAIVLRGDVKEGRGEPNFSGYYVPNPLSSIGWEESKEESLKRQAPGSDRLVKSILNIERRKNWQAAGSKMTERRTDENPEELAVSVTRGLTHLSPYAGETLQ